jgi:beta-fructofuranosidase
MLSLPDKWIWDFWFAQDGDEYHIFYLQAPKSLKLEHRRHHNATIGHAVSTNLIDWNILPDALIPGKDGMWDDLATWTGSIIKHNNLWYLFYTGVNEEERGLIQRIGVATSKDLMNWEKHSRNPIIEADEKYYELLDLKTWHDQAWRDPWVFSYQGTFHAFITARVNYGSPDGRGVIACAKSEDLLNWSVMPPVTEPGEFGQLEVPQLIKLNSKYFLLFSTGSEYHSAQRLKRTKIEAVTGTHYLVADEPLGPYNYIADRFLQGDQFGSLYSGKIIQNKNGEWKMMACNNRSKDDSFIGAITNPFSVQLEKNKLTKL